MIVPPAALRCLIRARDHLHKAVKDRPKLLQYDDVREAILEVDASLAAIESANASPPDPALVGHVAKQYPGSFSANKQP